MPRDSGESSALFTLVNVMDLRATTAASHGGCTSTTSSSTASVPRRSSCRSTTPCVNIWYTRLCVTSQRRRPVSRAIAGRRHTWSCPFARGHHRHLTVRSVHRHLKYVYGSVVTFAVSDIACGRWRPGHPSRTVTVARVALRGKRRSSHTVYRVKLYLLGYDNELRIRWLGL